MRTFKTNVICLLLLYCLFGCASVHATKKEVKTIVIGGAAKVATLQYILNNWSKIENGILEIDSRECVKKEASLEAVEAINEIFGDTRLLVVGNKELLSKNSRVFVITTKNFCESESKYTIGPTWSIINNNGDFKIKGPSYIEE